MNKGTDRKKTLPKRRLVQALGFIVFLLLFFCSGRAAGPGPDGETVGHLVLLKTLMRLDPLVSLSSALAARTLHWSMAVAAVVLLTCAIIPRWFCAYLCPMGTFIDVIDGIICRRIRRFRLNTRGWWVHLRFALLAGALGAAALGVLVSGFVAALPLFARGVLFIFAPLQTGLSSRWSEVSVWTLGRFLSVLLFLVIPALGLLRLRFWCAYLCPSGALLSTPGLLGGFRRTVKSSCSQCGQCVRVCSFDAIGNDYTTRLLNCSTCKSCQSVCPKQSIEFRCSYGWIRAEAHVPGIARASVAGRRHFFLGMLGATGAGLGIASGLVRERKAYSASYPIRPPGSVPEDQFLGQCVRCGQCLQACPSRVLQPAGFELGIDGLWTPVLNADLAGCVPECNNCGQVCPTNAIRSLPLKEKHAARLGLAVIQTNTCLPHCQKEACGWCVDECNKAGYHAIEYVRIGLEYDSRGMPVVDSGFLTPVVLADKCVGCGLCQARCRAVNVVEKGLLAESAVIIVAGSDNEDRIASGSYQVLKDRRERRGRPKPAEPAENEYLPDFLQ